MLPRLLFATPTVAEPPLLVFGGGEAAVALLLSLLLPQPATANATSATAARAATTGMDLVRIMGYMLLLGPALVVGTRATLSPTPAGVEAGPPNAAAVREKPPRG